MNGRLYTTEQNVAEVGECDCGSSPGGDVSSQRSAGVAIEADREIGDDTAAVNNGQIYTRSLPNRGCVFIADSPPLAVPAPTMSDR